MLTDLYNLFFVFSCYGYHRDLHLRTHSFPTLRASDLIVAVDVVDDKLALARQLGATDTFNAAEEGAVEAICAATGGGVDYAFEMAGSVKAMDLCYRVTRRGGTTDRKSVV